MLILLMTLWSSSDSWLSPAFSRSRWLQQWRGRWFESINEPPGEVRCQRNKWRLIFKMRLDVSSSLSPTSHCIGDLFNVHSFIFQNKILIETPDLLPPLRKMCSKNCQELLYVKCIYGIILREYFLYFSLLSFATWLKWRCLFKGGGIQGTGTN